MKYNRALDLLASALYNAKKGRMNAAARQFDAAVKCSSSSDAMRIIEANNSKAHAALKAAAKKAVKAGDIDSKPKSGVPDQNPGAELKEQPDENGDRIVQEADFDDLDSDDDEVEAAAEDDEDMMEDDEDEDTKAAVAAATRIRSTPNQNFARALKNLHALKQD